MPPLDAHHDLSEWSDSNDQGQKVADILSDSVYELLRGSLRGDLAAGYEHGRLAQTDRSDLRPLAEQVSPPDEKGAVLNPDGSRQQLRDGLVTKIRYPDGSSREFEYDKQAQPIKEVTPDGTVWTRDGTSDQWASDQGGRRTGRLLVELEGSSTFLHQDGTREVFYRSGESGKSQPQIDSQDLKRILKKDFDRLDENHDGLISEEEINAAIEDRSFTGEDAQMVAVLKAAYSFLRSLRSQDFDDAAALKPRSPWSVVREIVSDQNGISMDEVLKFDAIQRSVNAECLQLTMLGEFGSKSYSLVDSDDNGFITRDEIDRALAKTEIKDQDRQALQFMRKKFAEIESASNDEWGPERSGITKKDIEAYLRQFAQSDDYKLVVGTDDLLCRAKDKVEKSSRSLYADQDNPLASIKPEAVVQGSVGDCYLMCAMASLANCNPQAIKDMIRDNHDGTYTVRLPGAPSEPITVTTPTDLELILYAGGGRYGVWPAVLEKAYGQYRNNHKLFFQNKGPASEGGDGGGRLREGLKAMTGKDSQFILIEQRSESQLAQLLQGAINDGRPVVVSGHVKNSLRGAMKDGQPLVTDGNEVDGLHGFSVLGYDPETRIVTIRNPWGTVGTMKSQCGAREDSDDGVFQLTLGDFKRNFTALAC